MSSGTLPASVYTGFWTLDRVAAALTPHSDVNLPLGSTELRAVSTDTRHIEPGDIFVALAGERFDAHDFLEDAVGKGAAALVVSRADRATGCPEFQRPVSF